MLAQEQADFKKFTASLLSRSGKVTDLVNSLNAYGSEVQHASPDQARLNK